MFLFRRKKRGGGIDEKQLSKVIEQELSDYIKREELGQYLKNIEKDKKKKQLWDSLPARKKIKLLRYALEKKGVEYGGKKTV